MKEIIIIDKQKYLIENYPFGEIPKLTDTRLCIHCNKVIKIGDFKVFKEEDEDGFEYICCPNTPECNGTVIDWMEVR